ncbi:hypothetical protein ABZ413_36540 [Nocardia rhamnosiphila]|uniref:hypothetical protein n=1 Tax=Nocardia rhamnosiphila TaxID=426716 RepID=UPI00340282F3
MQRAAGVSSVQLVCHRDTWRVVDGWFVGDFGHDVRGRVPRDRVKGRGDTVEVTLSGVSLVGLLKAAQERTSVANYYPDTRAIARRIYEQVAKVIDAVDPEATPGQAIPPIVLDDKLGDQAAG